MLESVTMIKINIDGCCEPINPGGHAGYGYSIFNDDACLNEFSGFIEQSPFNSSNVAEYKALITALEWLNDNGFNDDSIEIRSDSKLLVKQMQGKWGIKEGLYFDYAIKAKLMTNDFHKIKFTWIPRELNTIADELSRRELMRVKLINYKQAG